MNTLVESASIKHVFEKVCYSSCKHTLLSIYRCYWYLHTFTEYVYDILKIEKSQNQNLNAM